MKNPCLKFFVLALALAGVYLYLAHAYIYYKIGAAGLKTFDWEHAYTLGDAAVSKNLVYVSLGDSLAAGAGVDKYEESYPYLLAQKLVDNNKIILKNFSVPGYKTDDLINNLLMPAITEKPDIVTLLIGVNDVHGNVSKTQFEKSYRHILEELTRGTKAKIYAINIPSIGSDSLVLPPYNYYYDWRTTQFNVIIKKLAEEYNIKYIDLNTPTAAMLKVDGLHYAVDSFHLSAYGYALWTKIIYDAINQ